MTTLPCEHKDVSKIKEQTFKLNLDPKLFIGLDLSKFTINACSEDGKELRQWKAIKRREAYLQAMNDIFKLHGHD
jgi:hypothetical protein